jgi:alpha-mannosidase
MPTRVRRLLVVLSWAAFFAALPVAASPPDERDLAREPTLYVVGYAHLDTEWRWEYPRTIAEFLPKTLRDNFALFEKYPHYVFNFSGANRYRMIKEYFPADYGLLKRYVAAGRWFPAGSSMEEGDVNSASAESIVRQILYGSRFFRREFGKSSAEYMLPDCFGFPASLPSILAHMGLKGFSTQKLSWGSAAPVGGPDSPERTPAGIPFNVGRWEGPDGRSVIAAFNPGSYGGDIDQDLSTSPRAQDPGGPNPPVDWPARVKRNGEISGLFADYHYYGVGDTGGSPREPSVRLLDAIMSKTLTQLPAPRGPGREDPPKVGPEVRVGEGPLKIVSATSEQMFLDITPEQAAGLPRYKGDLLLTNHSAGSLTSQAYQKRWNRKNELLADAAERAAVAAAWLGGRPYPQQRLNDAWTLVMGGQFHDLLPGTATAKAFEYAWNDQVIAMNQFASVLESASGAIVAGLDTRVRGRAVVVYNPLNIRREDVVEADLAFPAGVPRAVRVVGPDGKETPAQLSGAKDGVARVLFLAQLPSVGYAVYDVQPAETPAVSPALRVGEGVLENARYRLRLDTEGDLASVFDKQLRRELLASPVRLALLSEKPKDWPAWNMDWADQQKPPRAFVRGPVTLHVVERGAARVAVETVREAEGSRFVQTIRLAAGDGGNRIEIGNVVEWRTAEAALKATFPLAATNPEATYNWDVGTVTRRNNDEKKFEVPSHQWLDLTDVGGAFGVTVLSDCKIGSDKPDDRTLRLTLLYTPGLGDGNGRAYSDQLSQDWGRHEIAFGLAAHAGDWRRAGTDWQAQRLNQPPIAFETPAHPGPLGRSFSLMTVSHGRVRALALKKAEEGDEVVLRLVELDGQTARDVRVRFPAALVSAREIDGQEQPVGPAKVVGGELVTELSAHQLRSFALKLAAAPGPLAAPAWAPVALPYDRSVATPDGRPGLGSFDAQGRALPAEMLPAEIAHAGIRFRLAPATEGKPNAVVARGQVVPLPEGHFTRLWLLAASSEGDQKAAFRVGEQTTELTIQDWGGAIGQWDTRSFNLKQEPIPVAPGRPSRTRTVWEYAGLTPGFIKRAPLGWFASHRHASDGANEPYAYAYLFVHALDVSAAARTLTLPDNDRVRLLAATVSEEPAGVRPARPLYDTLERDE